MHHSPIRSFDGIYPCIGENCFVDASAVVIGDVTLAPNTSVWPCAVIRGDVNSIHIGAGSNVQDFAMLHVSHKRDDDPLGAPLIIGHDVTIGHRVTLHGCTIGDEVLVGIGTIILDRAIVDSRVLIGAGSLVAPGKRLESGYLYLGNPAKQIRRLTASELAYFSYSAQHYQRLAHAYNASFPQSERTFVDSTN